MRVPAFAIALVFVVACVGSTTAPEPTPTPVTVTGTWGSTGSIIMTLTLSQRVDGAVTGSGNIFIAGTGQRALAVSDGNFSGTLFTATLNTTGFLPINVRAGVAGNTMTAALTGSGYNGETVTLVRSP